MSDENKTTSQSGAPILTDAEHQQVHAQLHGGKGKGKAVEDMDMDDDSSSEEEEQAAPEEHEEGEEDNMDEIDEDNIISGGRRTRGKTIDFAKAAEGLDDDEDEDEDDDFEDPEEMKQ
ncbi:MAG: Carboxylic ester hydrolase [Aureobasidium pullulans]|nr:MAG: Carboxylic ester hydrolase [Aureobasidium pullulans]